MSDNNKIPDVEFTDERKSVLTTLSIIGNKDDECLKEGNRYEYKLDNESYSVKPVSGIISPSRIPNRKEQGRIEPGNYVGLLKLELLEKGSGEKVDEKYIDVKSTKLNYEDEYRSMLEDIADKCADFLLQLESPVEQGFNPEEEVEEPTLAQRLYFLRNLLGSEDFQLAVHRIVTMPNTRWCEELRSIKTAQSGRLGKYEVKQLAKGNRRVELPGNHPLRRIMPSVPEEIEIRNKRDTVDTPENRFVKHALTVFLQTLEDMVAKFAELNSGKYPGLTDEINDRINWLEETLSHSVFKEVSPLSLLPLNSPILQRKEGYRQVLRSWMLFDLAARLSWEGGDDVYGAGKRNAAVLYEYWVFFKLLEIVSTSFNLDNPPVKDLINDKDLMLKLKSGKRMPIKGYCETSGRRLRVEFSYNRTFSGVDSYPQAGSWTRQMRPDYSLSLWPAEFSQDEAEEQELITHVHFDAKYKVDNLVEIMGEEPENSEEEEEMLNEEKEQQRSGNYKRGDLLKMHAYRDAIRRSAGAYVLYPGYDDPTTRFRGFHELLPGLGAFPLRPGTADDGTEALSNFLEEITEHVCNRATQREQHSFHTYRIHNSSQPELHEAFPEKEYGSDKRSLPPAETFVLHGWHSGKENLDWITESGYYNYRTEDKRGSLRLEESVANASYILLHGEGEYRNATKLFRITKRGPRVFSKEKLIENGYPGAASQPYYIVYDVKPLENDDQLNFYSWDLSKLDDIPTGRASAIPKAIPFNEFMKAAQKKEF